MKIIHRLISLCLVACLTAEPLVAAPLGETATGKGSTQSPLFAKQALAEELSLPFGQSMLANIRPKLIRGIFTRNSRIDESLARLVGNGDYGHREFYSDPSLKPYPHLMSARSEVRFLLEHLIRKSVGTEQTELMAQNANLSESQLKEMPPEKLTSLLAELRHHTLRKELQDPNKYKKWISAIEWIDRELKTLRHDWGDSVADRTAQMISQIETALPLLGDHYDNFAEYATNIEHGLPHSLDMLQDELKIAAEMYKEPDELARVQHILIGAALFHDITGLREREGHHESARDLVYRVLTPLKNDQGQPLYAPDVIEEIAEACYRHRGQTYPPPLKDVQKIVMDADEYNVVRRLERIISQPANGAFQPDFWDGWRVDSMFEALNLSGKAIRHESDHADLFNYLLMTLIERTNPERYWTPVVKSWLTPERYLEWKGDVMRLIRTMIRAEVFGAGGQLHEVEKRAYRVKGIIRELEVLRRQDSYSRQRLRNQIGGAEHLANQIRTLCSSMQAATKVPVSNGLFNGSLHILDSIGEDLSQSRDIRAGYALADDYFENPFQSVRERLEEDHRHTTQLTGLYAGLADGIGRYAVRRVEELTRIIGVTEEEQATLQVEMSELRPVVARYILGRLSQNEPVNDVLRSVRHYLDVLRYGETRPETWDASEAGIRSVEELDSWIRAQESANLHVHSSGFERAETLADLFARLKKVCESFLKYMRESEPELQLNPTSAADLGHFQYKEVSSPKDFERPFTPAQFILNGDKGLFPIHRDWFKRILLAGAAQGNILTGVVATFNRHTKSDKEFESVVSAAASGLSEGEMEIEGGKTRGVMFLAFRKDQTIKEMRRNLERWLTLKEKLVRTRPALAAKLRGVDCVGFESDFAFKKVEGVFQLARQNKLWVKMHAGEFWPTRKLLEALQHLESIVQSSVINEITNPIALFVDAKTLNPEMYSAEARDHITKLQRSIYKKLNQKGVYVEISPSSNARLSRQNRRTEGWEFQRLDNAMSFLWNIVVTDDDPGIFNTDFVLEHIKLYLGWTPYGPVSFRSLRRLLDNSHRLAEEVLPSIGPLTPNSSRRFA